MIVGNLQSTLLNKPYNANNRPIPVELVDLYKNTPIEPLIKDAIKFNRPNLNDLLSFKDSQGNSLLHHASKLNAPQLIKKLIELGANPNILNNNGKSPIHFAIDHRHQENLENLVKSDKTDIHLAYSGKNYAEYAFEQKFLNAIKPILSCGINPDECSVILKRPTQLKNFKCEFFPPLTLLQAAVLINNRTLVETLIDKGSDLNSGNDTVLFNIKHKIRNDPNFPSEKYLYSSYSPLQLAILSGNLEMIKLLICRGANSKLPLPTGPQSLPFYKNIPEKYSNKYFQPIMHYIDNHDILLKTETKEKIKSLLASKNNKNVHQNILLHKELSHVWSVGRGRTFEIANKYFDNYEGYWHNPSAKIVSNNLTQFLLEHATDPFITEQIKEDLKYISKSILPNGNIRDKSSKQLLADINNGLPVIINARWKGHAASLLFYKNFVMKINNGEGSTDFAISCYEYKRVITESILSQIRTNKESEYFFNHEINELLNLSFREDLSLKKKSQSVGNCTLASKKLALLGVFFLMAKDHPLESIKNNPEKHAREVYRSFSYGMKRNILRKIKKQVETAPHSFDWSSLAEVYIKAQKKSDSQSTTSKLTQINQIFKEIYQNRQIDAKLSKNINYFHFLIATGREEKIPLQRLVATCNPRNDQKSLLHTAIESKNINALSKLLAVGANPNIQNHDKETALTVAFKKDFKEGVQMLLATGKIDLNLKDSNDLNCFTRIFYDKKENILLELPKNLIIDLLPKLIFIALIFENYDFIDQFIAKFEINVNESPYKDIFLNEGFNGDNPKIFEILDRHGYDFDNHDSLLSRCLQDNKLQLADFLTKRTPLINLKCIRTVRNKKLL